jgi:hypothetical protein
MSTVRRFRVNNKRFEIKNGKFGPFFYDSIDKKDLPLDSVLSILNKPELPPVLDFKKSGKITLFSYIYKEINGSIFQSAWSDSKFDVFGKGITLLATEERTVEVKS